MILASCGGRTISSSSKESSAAPISNGSGSLNDSSTVSSSSSSGPASSNSSSTSIDLDAAYQISQQQFVDFFFTRLSNSTVTLEESRVNDETPTLKKDVHTVFHFTPTSRKIETQNPDGSSSLTVNRLQEDFLAQVYKSTDSSGKVSYSSGSWWNQTTDDVLRGERRTIITDLLMPNPLLNSWGDTPDSGVKAFLPYLYDQLVYQKESHTYEIPEDTSLAIGLKKLSLSFKDGNLLSATSQSRYQLSSAFYTGSFSASFSAIGTTQITLESDLASQLNLHRVSCYSDDGTTLLGTAIALDGQGPNINFPLGKKADSADYAYVFAGWDKDLSAVTSDLSVKASFTKINASDLYTFKNGTLSLKANLAKYPTSLILPSTFTNSQGVVSAVTSFAVKDIGSSATEITLNPTMTSLTADSQFLNRATEFHLNGNPNFKLIGSSLYSADGTSLYLLNEKDEAENLVLPASLTTILPYACYHRPSIKSVSFPSGLTTLGIYGFTGSGITRLDLPEGVNSVGWWCFAESSALAEAHLPESLTTIAERMFCNDCLLKDLTYSSKLAGIGYSAFRNDPSLTSFVFPDTLSMVQAGAFNNSGLTSVSLSRNPSAWSGNIGVFQNCVHLKSLFVPKEITELESLCQGDLSLSEVTFEEGSRLTVIDSYAFDSCPSLTTLDLRKETSLTTLKAGAFRQEVNLKEVYLPMSLTSIESSAFGLDPSLTSLVIPASVTSISKGAFTRDAKLSLYLEATSLPSFSQGWNEYESGSANTLPTYCYSETTPSSNPTAYWHYVNGVPTAYNV